VQKAETDSGQRPGTTSDDKRKIAELEREVRELRRANEILKAAIASRMDLVASAMTPIVYRAA
jgi:transposase